ncbi:MAG: hypothetical protein HYV07_08915 [Deltaproteobacteria bacterium]|nr:hypothetical protein [Deltaproteobacteria bacterium]
MDTSFAYQAAPWIANTWVFALGLIASCGDQKLVAFYADGAALEWHGATDATHPTTDASSLDARDGGATPDVAPGDGPAAGDGSVACGDRPVVPSTQGTWACASPMAFPRRGHTATLLGDGHVLVTGAGSAEIYVPATDEWLVATVPLATRHGHAAATLTDGRILIVGGSSSADGDAPLRTCELFDPIGRRWSEAGTMNHPRYRAAVTVLRDGRVLVAAGDPSAATSEVYDPGLDAWTIVAQVPFASTRASSALLSDGRVLLVGGTESLAAALYDPETSGWAATASLKHPEADVAAVAPLAENRALSFGSRFVQSFDPARDLWTTTGTRAERVQGDVRIPFDRTGRLLSAGGTSMERAVLEADLFDNATTTWIPAGRLQHPRVETAAASLSDGRVAVFGGCEDAACARQLRSVEIFTPNSWSCGNGRVEYPETCDQLNQTCSRTCVIPLCSSSSPPFLQRQEHALAYDFVRQRSVLFGGTVGVSTFDDTRELTMGGTWLWLQDVALHAPPRRSGHTLAFDGHRGRTVLFGGGDHAGALWQDTWTWDGARWANVSTTDSPPARLGHTMAWMRTRGRIVIHGGSGRQDPYSDTWEWDGSRWNESANAGGPRRQEHVMVHDLNSDRLVFFGGDDGTLRDDFWTYDGESWREVLEEGPRPPARARYAAAYDAGRRRVVVFGGTGTHGPLGDTWEWDGAHWRVATATGPPARSGAAMVFDAADERVLLLGGWDGKRQLDDLWAWDGTSWSLVTFEPGCAP